jgi:hypothetical protein
MKLKLPVLLCILFIAFGCSKDNNSSIPNIKLESYNSEVDPDGIFRGQFSYSQSKGNLTGDSLVIHYHRYNESQIPDEDLRPDSLITNMPSTPNANKAEFTVDLSWVALSYGINNENDTIDLSFVLVDPQGNHSDTVKTGKVIVVYQ